jgi:hypothetical protein
MKRKATIAMMLMSAMLISACGSNRNDTLSQISTDKKIESNGTILDVLVADYSTNDEIKKALSASNISYKEEDEGIFSEGTVKFLDYDSTFEIYCSEGSIYEAYANIYFSDKNTYDSAKNTLSDYLSTKIKDSKGLETTYDAEADITYYPITTFKSEDEEMVLYLTLSSTEFESTPSGDYMSYGYEIAEGTAYLSDWDIMTSPTGEDADIEDDEEADTEDEDE